MKKLLLFFGCFISVLSAAQEIDKPYDFPIKIGTKQWAELTSSKQMDEVCVIPEDVLNSLSTKALLITCINYPRLLDIFLSSNLQTGFNFNANHFAGLRYLLKKPDLGDVLLKTYIDFDISSSIIDGYNRKLKYIQVAFLELLISQESIINAFNKSDKLKLLSQAIKNLEQRKKYGDSLFRQRTTALILSRILNSNGVELSQIDIYGNDVYKIFNTNVVILDTTIIDTILIESKNLLSQE